MNATHEQTYMCQPAFSFHPTSQTFLSAPSTHLRVNELLDQANKLSDLLTVLQQRMMFLNI